ncbi:MAG: GGDEF domain-containing protein [Sulfurimonas sp.]|nr:GGDEF domain-containing protein [Sulfurimonas sp.]
MVSKQKKIYLIAKIIIIILFALLVVSVMRVLILCDGLLDYGSIYMLFIRELFFSIGSSIFVIALLYIVMKREIYLINNKVRKYAYTDGLTGLNNRHYLNDFLNKFSSLRKEDTSFAVLFIDIDRFKDVNDRLGHSTGDCILKGLAQHFESLVRPNDILCRYGGEEFVIIYSDISKDDALKKAQQIRTTVQDMLFNCKQESITISIGLSSASRDADINRIIEEADSALYIAKDAGRNCVKVFASEYKN